MLEVLKQALEALENSIDLVIEDAYNAEQLYANVPTRQAKVGGLKLLADEHQKAITSLRQAIAEAEKQEGQSNFCAQCEALSRELKAIKQEQGEPVGYLEIDDIESQREYPHNCRNVNLWYESGEGLVAVYTHPPQRTWVGLTDEIPKGVLLAISNAGLTLLKTQHGYELRKLGPAVAHGIKE